MKLGSVGGFIDSSTYPLSDYYLSLEDVRREGDIVIYDNTPDKR